MSSSRTVRAIVLKSVDVGEADRFCILFTRERGRLAARANGVRRLLSRLHALQPGRVLGVELHESTSGARITGAAHDMGAPVAAGVLAFGRAQQGLELLLALLHDEEPLPAAFDDTARFLVLCHDDDDPVPAFTLRMLQHLGLLPQTEDDTRYRALSVADRGAIRVCAGSEWHASPAVALAPHIRVFITSLLRDHLPRPLRAESVMKMME
jgi:recombinational DNA repair protein (RecF pathway)